MSTETAPDPRMDAVMEWIAPDREPDDNDRFRVRMIVQSADAADCAAGVIRVQTDDATAEKVARALHAYHSSVDPAVIEGDARAVAWDEDMSIMRDIYRSDARAVLKALVTP